MTVALSPIPDFGDVVHRDVLVDLFERRSPAVTLLCAPAGYGKSVLAGQFARCNKFDAVHWVSFEGHLVGSEDFLAQLSHTLLPDDGSEAASIATALPVSPRTQADAVLSVREALKPMRHVTVCFVVDGLDVVSDPLRLLELSRLLQECTSPTSRVVVTCRDLSTRPIEAKQHFWLMDEMDLRFRSDEARELLAIAGDEAIGSEAVERLLSQSGGQPALADLLARHPRLLLEQAETGIPRDLIWHIESMIDPLGDVEISALYAAALLGEGRITDVEKIVEIGPDQWIRVVSTTPLLTFAVHETTGERTFSIHGVLGDVLSDRAGHRLQVSCLERLRAGVYSVLQSRGDYSRLANVLVKHASPAERRSCCSNMGSMMLRSVGPVAVSQILDLIPASDVAGSPTLLLLLAAVRREQEYLSEALDKAGLARSLADCLQDRPAYVDASLMLARIALDLGDFQATESALRPLSLESDRWITPDRRCLVSAYLALVDSQAGRLVEARKHSEAVHELLGRLDSTSEAVVFATNCMAFVQGVTMGEWVHAIEGLRRLVRRPGLAPVQALLIRANYAVALLELGRIDQAERELETVVALVEACGARQMKAYALDTLAGVLATQGDPQQARAIHEGSISVIAELGDSLGIASTSTCWAMVCRGSGLGHLALAAAESAVSAATENQGTISLPAGLAQVEVAASLLALGDPRLAIGRIEQIRPLFEAAEAKYHLLRADMVLAEAQRVAGDFAGAVSRLMGHVDYILSESSNWQIAMYVRAFPGLLAVISQALGSNELPVHIVRMIPEPYAEECLRVAKEHLGSAEYREVVQRFESATSPEDLEPQAGSAVPCYVRLFGGLEVTTEFGTVQEASWSKRKARLMFAMLAARRGQEIPRDVLLERLWPDMDEDRARNNYYVMWSAMKRALACGGKAEAAAKYVANAGSLCRVTSLVRTDLDDFEDALRSLLAAENAGHGPGVLAAAQQICDLYRGEVLPGDVYDDWFTDLRDRYRHDFCDAMLSAAIVAERAGDLGHAIGFVRKALAFDPWREDLYQTAIRCQIQAGQRSGAIEMYFSCRNRLNDDLGIDPSSETQRLYENVLAMEEPPESLDFASPMSPESQDLASGG